MEFARSVVALTISVGLVACATREVKPYVAPDRPAGKLKSIAYLPYFGAALPPPTQNSLAGSWTEWWVAVFPGTKWLKPIEASETLAASGALAKWSEAEAGFLKTGALGTETVDELCKALKVDGLLQGVVSVLDSGTTSTSAGVGIASGGGLFGNAFGIGRRSTGSKVGMTMTLVSCETRRSVWLATFEDSYRKSYPAADLASWAQQGLASRIGAE